MNIRRLIALTASTTALLSVITVAPSQAANNVKTYENCTTAGASKRSITGGFVWDSTGGGSAILDTVRITAKVKLTGDAVHIMYVDGSLKSYDWDTFDNGSYIKKGVRYYWYQMSVGYSRVTYAAVEAHQRSHPSRSCATLYDGPYGRY